MPEIARHPDATPAELNLMLDVDAVMHQCVIAGSVATVTDKLIGMADQLGRFGTLVCVGHDWDQTDRWQRSIVTMAQDVAPRLARHLQSLPA